MGQFILMHLISVVFGTFVAVQWGLTGPGGVALMIFLSGILMVILNDIYQTYKKEGQ